MLYNSFLFGCILLIKIKYYDLIAIKRIVQNILIPDIAGKFIFTCSESFSIY